MKRLSLNLLLFFFGGIVQAQVISADSSTNEPLNTAQNILAGNGGKAITVAGYGEVHFNQEFSETHRHNGKMDVHRVIMFLGYKFSHKTFFVTELELTWEWFEGVSKTVLGLGASIGFSTLP